ncbi:MAG: LptF/LptG family permease, partial [Pseudomonadota bacterium]
ALGVFATTVYSPVASGMREQYDLLRVEVFGGRTSFMETGRSGAWLRQRGVDGETVIHADSTADRGTRLANVTVFAYDSDQQFVERVDAATAELKPGHWNLTEAIVRRPGGVEEEFSDYVVSTHLSPEQVYEIFGSAESVGFWDLPSLIEASETAGLPALRYKIQYQALLAQPLSFIAMVLVAATVSLKIFRLGNVARMIIIGVVAGFVLYVFTQVARDLGANGTTTPAIAAWLPAIIASLMSVSVLLHQEDG